MAAQHTSSMGDNKQMAERLRKRYNWLSSFNDDELIKISMCQLEEGEKQENEPYFDLSQPERGAFQGKEGHLVPDGSCFVARGQLTEGLWNKLVGYFRGR